MIKLVLFLIFGVGAGIMLLSQKRRNSQARSHSDKLARISSLDNFDFESLKEIFDTLIRRKSFQARVNTSVLDKEFITQASTKEFNDKYKIKGISKSLNNEFLVAADAKSNDVLPTRNGNKLIDKYYPCSILIKIDQQANEVTFFSSFPDDKEHEYLLKEFSDSIFSLLCEEKTVHANG